MKWRWVLQFASDPFKDLDGSTVVTLTNHLLVLIRTEELIRKSRLPASALVEVGSDHRLADPEPVAAMLHACEG